MKTLFFVESPLQLLNAYEAKYFFKIESYIYYIRLSGEKNNDSQILNMIEKLKLSNIKFIYLKSKNKSFSDFMKILLYKFYYLFFNVEKVFIGNFDSEFFKLIIRQFDGKKIILLDDGAKTIPIQKTFTEYNFYNLFTMYNITPIGNQKIYKNQYKALLGKINKDSTQSNKILFLGTKLSEIGIISEEYYIELLKKISVYYDDKEIIYIIHRGESKKKLKIIESNKNISIKQLEYPVEFYGLYENEIPHMVSSFYSTALLTMKDIYNIEAESFLFDYKNSEHKENIDNVYSYNKNYMKVVKLDD